jgi:hypothetical protein
MQHKQNHFDLMEEGNLWRQLMRLHYFKSFPGTKSSCKVRSHLNDTVRM